MKQFLTALCALFPSKLAHFFLKLLGHDISWKSKIGFSILYVKKICLTNNAIIGHFNLFKIESIFLKKDSSIGSFNLFKGPFHILLESNTNIGKLNRFQRGSFPISYDKSELKIGQGTRITTGNYFDLTNSITFGEDSQVAGMESQFWTHGYMHADKGIDRIRIDGEIKIGNNVYIGSRCLFNPGVTVFDAINIGGNSVISKDLKTSGMYVNQTLRYIETDINKTRQKLKKVETSGLIEEVYTKNN